MFAGGPHQLHLPELVEALWRSGFFILACVALGHYCGFIYHPGFPRSRRVLMAALILATLQPVLVNLERWGQPIYLEGLPLQTVYVTLGLIGVRIAIREERARLAREARDVRDVRDDA